jgi:ferrochelatase
MSTAPRRAAADEDPLAPYDALLLLSFGGPEGEEEVMPFLRRVTAGRGIPDARLALVAQHYLDRGGVSPINAENRALLDLLRADLDSRGIPTPLLWGNRNAEPFLVDTLRDAHAAGARRVLAILTSAYSSYSSCRQYREDLARAVTGLAEEGAADLVVDKIRPYAVHPAFVATTARLVVEAVRPLAHRTGLRLVFVTHSVPVAMDDTSGPGDGEGNLYVDQHLRVGAAVTDEVAAAVGVRPPQELVFCSRSGPPHQPWLEPDVNDRLVELAAEGAEVVVLVPIGFVSDHMEVVQDLDTEAAGTASAVGLEVVRVPTVGRDTAFAAGLVDLALERAAEARGEAVDLVTALPGDVRPSVCDPGCCPNLRVAEPALCGRDRP